MKIYTVTFTNTVNVGAALQEYALMKYLQLKGHETAVLHFVPPVMARAGSVWPDYIENRSIFQCIKKLLLLPVNMHRKVKYQIFYNKYLTLTPLCTSTSDIEKLEQPDLYIAGSDQIWNDEIVHWEDGFFLHFQTGAKKAAYAGSAGRDDFSEEFRYLLKNRLQDFCAVSVREEALQKVCLSEGIAEAVQVLDPVFLLSAKHYESILIKPRIHNYILLYETEVNENCILAARKLARQFHLKIAQINHINNRYHADRLYPGVSPLEFLGLVKYADYIVTNSFHATAFSLIFEKQFWVIKLNNRFSRLESILKTAGVRNRVLYASEVDASDRIDYQPVNRKLKRARKQSVEFLNRITRECGDDA